MIKSIIQNQREYFLSGATLPIEYRKKSLKRLLNIIEANEDKIAKALYSDLGKSMHESYMCEIGMVKSEIQFMLKHIQKFTKSKTVRTPLNQFMAKSSILAKPYGVTLILSPWNYPFLLTMGPLVNCLAAGNCAVLKPSAYSPHTSELISKIISFAYDPCYVTCITGGRKENQALLEQKFDYIFFTGSPTVGHIVMEKASKNLTPVTLELGGKSPCIIDETANIELAAKRIVFGKFLNCGQTCVAPDYILCDKRIQDTLQAKIREECKKQYPDALNNPNYGKIINAKHFERLIKLIEQKKVIYGGRIHRQSLQIEPTVLTDISWSDSIMQEEIFGPLLPILSYSDLNDLICELKKKPTPLALYFFSQNKVSQKMVMQNLHFGGGCINDTIIHLTNPHLPFGGLGNSGMGQYHGKAGFDTFTHYTSIIDKKTWIDIPLRYAPYSKKKAKWVRRFL